MEFIGQPGLSSSHLNKSKQTNCEMEDKLCLAGVEQWWLACFVEWVGYEPEAPLRKGIPLHKDKSFFHFILFAFQQTCPSEERSQLLLFY